MKVAAGGGTPEPATVLDASRGEAGHRFPCFLPDGEHFLFSVLPPGPHGFPIRVGSLRSTASVPLLEAESGASFVAPGYLVFVANGKLTAQRFDPRRLKLSGARFTLDDAPIPGDMDAEPVASGSRDGRLLYLQSRHPDARLEWLDRGGASRGVVGLPEGDWELLALSPDQRSALATRDGDLWQVDLQRAVPTRLLRNVDPVENAVFSPDGRRIAATSREAGHEVIRILNSGGSGAVDSLPAIRSLFQEAVAWSPDGQSLLVAVLGRLDKGADQSGSWDLWTVPPGGGEGKPYLATPAFERQARLSPDGRWTACVPRSEGRFDLFLDSYPVPGHRTQVLSGEPIRNLQVMWGRQGRELLYSDAASNLLAMPLEFTGGDAHAGTPAKLFAVPEGVTAMETADGERFLVVRRDESARGPSLRLVLGWTGLLRK
jgi:dipeptidyl aminopeptidase/acylaminoacyl peptidase